MDPYLLEKSDPYCLDPPAGATLLGRATWRRLLVIGDSIAAGLGDEVEGYRDRSWADRLADALSPSAYLNLGQAGARATEVRTNQLGCALDFGPDLAVVAAGANDAFSRSFDPAEVESELDCIVAALHGVGALVVTFSCFDLGRTSFGSPDRRAAVRERLHALGRLTAAVSRQHGGVHVNFLRHPALSDALISADGIHINRRGHAIVAADVIRALAKQRRAVRVADRPAIRRRPERRSGVYAAAMRYRFGGVELDTDTYELRSDGRIVDVEPQVFDVLAHPLAHRERVVTKEELLDTVWGDRFVSESALTTRIKQARQAVGDSGQHQRVVKTVHGRGYRFVAVVDESASVAARPQAAEVRPGTEPDVFVDPIPATRYVVNDGASIAFQVFGDGPDLVLIEGFTTNVEVQ